MKKILLALLLFQNGPQTVGVVTGVVHGVNGAPASGVRVFALEAREGGDPAKSSVALESISVTDDMGHYRLEIATGRYYIASGSVESPTFSPGTPDIAAAREVRVTAGTVVANVDFSSFVPAARTFQFGSPLPLPPGSTGVLGGVIRDADGKPASGIFVTTVPAPLNMGTVSPSSILTQRMLATFRTQGYTDANGRYRINSVSPGAYFIAAGFAEAPGFYPGTSDILTAKTITTTPTTNLDNLDFTVPRPAAGVRITGHVTAAGTVPAVGAMVQIQNQSLISQAVAASGLPSRIPQYPAAVNADGGMEYRDVLPGSYVLQASFSGVTPVSRSIIVADQPVDGVELSIPIGLFSGRILLEDGSTPPNPQGFGDAIVTTVNNRNMIMSIIMPISATGTFSRPMEPDEYRFSLRTLPEGYTIKSVSAGDKNLLRETVKVGDAGPINIEIRVAKKTESDQGEVRLSGKAIDAVSGAPSAADLVTICCREAGISERFSTPLRSDGSFEFRSIPPGRYYVGLQVSSGRPVLSVANSGIPVEVGSQGVAEMELLSAQRFVPVMATTVNEGGGRLDAGSSVSVVFVGTSPRNRIVATFGDAGVWGALLPVGDIYTAKVENLPSGFSVRSTSGPMDFRTVLPVVNAIGAPPPNPTVVITLSSP